MIIRITYKCKGEDNEFSFELSPREYFDPLEPNETFEKDGIPAFNHAHQYISRANPTIAPTDLDHTILAIDESDSHAMVIKTTFFPNNSDLIHRRGPDGYELVIQSIRVAENCCVITRMERNDHSSSWYNVSYTTHINYEANSGTEKYIQASKGEYIPLNISTDW